MQFNVSSSLEANTSYSYDSPDSQNATKTSQNSNIALDIFKGIGMTSIIIATILGNLLVITSILYFKRLRSMNNYFIFSLAVADLLVGLLVQPFNMYNEMVKGDWKFGHGVCNLYNSNDVFFTTVSLLHICCICCDRYLAILHPFKYKRVMNRKTVLLMILASWVLSALLSFLPIFAGWYTTSKKIQALKDGKMCNFEVSQVYAFVSSSISFWTPCIIMVVLYQRIFRVARKQEKEIQKLQRAASVNYWNNNGAIEHVSSNHSRTLLATAKPSLRQTVKKGYTEAKKMQREHRAAKTLGMIMGMFLVCMGPIFLWYTITFGFCPKLCRLKVESEWIIGLVFWIGYLNSCMNPIVYAFFNRDFKMAFKQLFRACCDHKPDLPETSTTSEELAEDKVLVPLVN